MEIDRALSWNNKGLFFKFFFKIFLEDCLSLSSSERGNSQPPTLDSKSLNSNESANC